MDKRDHVRKWVMDSIDLLVPSPVSDVLTLAQSSCRRNDFAIQLTGERIARRPGQQQRRDAGLVIAGVDGNELSHELPA